MQSIRTKSRFSWHHYVLLTLLLTIILIRFVPGAGEWYARSIYPSVSLCLSFVASIVSFSLEEIIVILSVVFVIIYPVVSFVQRIKWHCILLHEVECVCWLIVWFYLGWGCNYFRSGFYARCQFEPIETEKVFFQEFLSDFSDSINACYPDEYILSREEAESIIKSQYRLLPDYLGLCQPQDFQRPKRVLFNRLYSAVGVLGYMGPFMSESQLNLQLLPEQYAFTYAHELAHLLSVSNEAEANYWAYMVCIESENRQLQFSGYYGLLPYLLNNAYSLLSPEEYQAWIASLDPRILEDLQAKGAFWKAQRIEWIDQVQEAFYDWYLRSNQIPAGRANYSQVVQMVLSARQKQIME